MNRTTAIAISMAAALLCGCPGLALAALGVFAAFGSPMPEIITQNTGTPEEAFGGAGIFMLCSGLLLVLIPVIVAVVSMRYAKPNEPGGDEPTSFTS